MGMKAADYSREELLEMLKEAVKREAMDRFNEFYGHMSKKELIEQLENF